MTEQPFPTTYRSADMLSHVHKETDVYDATGKHIGKVDGVYSGSGDARAIVPQTAGPVAAVPLPVATPQPAPMVETAQSPISHVPEFEDVLVPEDDVPREVREPLLHDGFIRIDAGFLHHHRYALPDQIASVGTERITLKVEEHELFKH